MNKIVYLIALFFFINSFTYSQTYEQLDNSSDFNSVRQIFQNELIGDADLDTLKGWKQFKRWEWFWSQRLQGESETPNALKIKQLAEYFKVLEKSKSNNVQSVTWEKYGPFYTPESDGRRQGVGRVNDLAISPSNENHLIAGAASGGAWRSTNKGSSWTEIILTSQMTITISDIEFSKSSPNVVYMATGDVNGSFGARDYYSVGLLKSTNSGISFSETNLVYELTDNKLVSKVIVHPSNPNIVLVSTSDGIYRTTDGGINWTQVLTGSLIKDLEFHPSNPSIVYSAAMTFNGRNTIYKSIDNGNSWTSLLDVIGARRTEIAVTPDSPNSVFLLSAGLNNEFYLLQKSTDEGQNWTTLATQSSAGNLLGWDDGSDLNTGQGFYDLSFAINPLNQNEIYIGGINIWSSTDGGTNWELRTHWSGAFEKILIHADQHQFTFSDNGEYLYVSNDGGLYRNKSGTHEWEELNNGMDITQFYRLSVSQSSSFDVLLGSQDNGSPRYDGQTWGKVFPSDGMECIIDPQNDNNIYISTPLGNLRRSTNGGRSFRNMLNHDILENLYEASESGYWVTPYLLEPGNPKIVYAGYNNVWKNRNYGIQDEWEKISDFGDGAAVNIISLAVSESNPNYIYAASNTSLRRSTDGGNTWEILLNSSNAITYIAVHPTNPNQVYLTKSGYNNEDKVVFFDGSNWKDISGNLPELPINTIVIENPEKLSVYIGTDIGVFYSDLNSGYWKKLEGELPNTIVTELEIHKATNKLYAATYGRGLWRTDLLGCNSNDIPINIIGELEFCEGDSLIIQSAVNLSEYLWNTGETTSQIVVKESGNYVLTNPSNSYCTDKSTIVTVKVFSPNEKIIESDQGIAFCNDIETIRLSVPFNLKKVKWSTDQTSKFISVTTPGMYFVEAENSNGCLVKDTLEIFRSDLKDDIEITRIGNTLSVPEGYSYKWYLDDIEIPESNSNTIVIDTFGVFSVDITDSFGCTINPNIIEILTGVNKITDNSNIRVYPSVTSDYLNIEIDTIASPKLKLSIFNLLGEIVYSDIYYNNSKNKVDMTSFAKGTYIIQLLNKDDIYTNKVIIK